MIKLQTGKRKMKTKKGVKEYYVFFLSVPTELVRQKKWKAGQEFLPLLTEEGIAYQEVKTDDSILREGIIHT